jgi:GH18 family chitinase
MRPLPRVLFACAALFLTCSVRAQTSEIIGYYPSWKHPGGVPLLPPERIPYQDLTIINYAFFAPLPDGTIVGRDTVGDAMVLRGQRLTQLAHRHGVRVVLSLGGWEDSGNFPAVAARAESRTRFAHSCIELIREFNFDGIDIDWEFPGYADHNGTPDDREYFILLLRELRDSLNTWPRHLLLTAAVPAGRATGGGLDIAAMDELLDFFNIMTYDFYGPWDPRANHNAPLYAS